MPGRSSFRFMFFVENTLCSVGEIDQGNSGSKSGNCLR